VLHVSPQTIPFTWIIPIKYITTSVVKTIYQVLKSEVMLSAFRSTAVRRVCTKPSKQDIYYKEFKTYGQIFHMGEYLLPSKPFVIRFEGMEQLREERGKSREGCGASH
jgi:hypothetical protein